MTQSSYRTPNLGAMRPRTADLGFWADIRYDASEENPDYVGLHLVNGAETSDANWKIYKFTYSGANVTRTQLAYGTWDGRAALFP
jgi:hypothetical protein